MFLPTNLLAVPISAELQDILPSVKKLHSFLTPLTYTDGRVAALMPQYRYFITSNASSIPYPPIGSTRDLFRRADARYGPDDPLRWPQPFNRRYPFMAAIAKRPTNSSTLEGQVMFLDLNDSDILFPNPSRPSDALVKDTIITALKTKIETLKKRVSAFFQGPRKSHYRSLIVENGRIMETCLLHLQKVPSPVRDLQRGLVELQRAYLTVGAILDYERRVVDAANIANSLIPEARAVNESRMGAFVQDDIDAQLLFCAGYPVYFLRDQHQFSEQIIEKVVEMVQPIPPALVVAPADPPYPVISTGQAGSDNKFAALQVAATNCLKTHDVFENFHHPTAYPSSYKINYSHIIDPVSSPPCVAPTPSRSAFTQPSSTSRRSRFLGPKKAAINRKSFYHFLEPP